MPPPPKAESAPIPPPVAETPPPAQVDNAPINNELDDLLSKAFPTNVDPVKEVEVQVKEDKKPDVALAKEKPKAPEQKEVKAPLPDPDTIDDKIIGKTQQSKDAWQALRTNYRTATNQIKEREEEIAKLKQGLGEKADLSAKEAEALRNEIKELSKYRTMVDIQADPEFVSKYDQPIEKAKESVKDMLKGLQVSDEVLGQIDFSNTKLMDDIIGHVGEHRDKITARRLQRKIEEIVDLMEKRGETLDSQKKNYKEFMEEKKKESSLKGAEYEGKVMKRLSSIAEAKDQAGNAAFPFLNKMTPAEGASQPELDQAANHNKVVDLMQQKLDMALKLDTPEGRAEVAVAAVASHYLSAQLRAATAKIASLEQELGKISNVTNETKESKPRGAPAAKNGEVVNLDDALSSHFGR